MYVESADILIRDKMKGFIHYDGIGKELSTLSLGSLIREFDRRTDKKKTVAALKELAKERNNIAHKGYLLSLDQLGQTESVSELVQRLERTLAKAKECLKSLGKETSRIRGE